MNQYKISESIIYDECNLFEKNLLKDKKFVISLRNLEENKL